MKAAITSQIIMHLEHRGLKTEHISLQLLEGAHGSGVECVCSIIPIPGILFSEIEESLRESLAIGIEKASSMLSPGTQGNGTVSL
mmetsp:Transcript_47503/g.98534  ORF Transcript_47503/g.98534 Transcript_47503/m.98534 type:complete len:85 (+) Transcript_47503:1-255(+)